KIRQKNIQCLFSEPQFPTKSLSTLTRVTDIQVGILDPLGSHIEVGKDHYLKMMQQVASDMSRCLTPA
ncbi:MAG: metal ABC transporter solute-binding protein, Zn/Mn family, partial [Granulosicoccaceae bacterium]